jgi:flagellar M-ring protein FliF
LVTLLIALALVFFVMRPLLRKVLTPEQPLALTASAEIGAMSPMMMESSPPMVGTPVPLPPMEYEEPEPGPRPPRVPAWMNNAKAIGESQAQTLKTVGELVDENPKQAALIVRDWLGSAA